MAGSRQGSPRTSKQQAHRSPSRDAAAHSRAGGKPQPLLKHGSGGADAAWQVAGPHEQQQQQPGLPKAPLRSISLGGIQSYHQPMRSLASSRLHSKCAAGTHPDPKLLLDDALAMMGPGSPIGTPLGQHRPGPRDSSGQSPQSGSAGEGSEQPDAAQAGALLQRMTLQRLGEAQRPSEGQQPSQLPDAQAQQQQWRGQTQSGISADRRPTGQEQAGAQQPPAEPQRSARGAALHQRRSSWSHGPRVPTPQQQAASIWATPVGADMSRLAMQAQQQQQQQQQMMYGYYPYMQPGMPQQVAMQASMYGSYPMMLGYYPHMHPGMMGMYGAMRPMQEPGVQPGARPQQPPVAGMGVRPVWPQPAYDPQYAAYYRLMEQQQAAAAASAGLMPGMAEAGVYENGRAPQRRMPVSQHSSENGLHRRSSSGFSSGSSTGRAGLDDRPARLPGRGGWGGGRPASLAGSGQPLNAGHAAPQVPPAAPGTPQLDAAAVVEHSTQAVALLERFKSTGKRSAPFELQDINGYVFEFCRDQHGSRFIQERLARATPEQVLQLYEEVQPRMLSLMTDVFGNYVIQKFLEHGNQEVLARIADQLKGNVLMLSLQMYGCRVIQKALEVLPLDDQRLLTRELEGMVMRSVRDQNGNHVIQKCIECVKPSCEINFIIEAVRGNVVSLSMHPYGCRVVQRVMEHCDSPQVHAAIVADILRSCMQLAMDQYGNYVIQHTIINGPAPARRHIIAVLTKSVILLSQHKFASNVMEKCLQYGELWERKAIIACALDSPPDGVAALQTVMKDQYGNYVVQKMLETCDEGQWGELMNRIREHLAQLKRFTFGKHVISRVEKLLVAGTTMAKVPQQPDGQQAGQKQQQRSGEAAVSMQQPAADSSEPQHGGAGSLEAAPLEMQQQGQPAQSPSQAPQDEAMQQQQSDHP